MNKIVGSKYSLTATIKEISERAGKTGPYTMWVFQADGAERCVGFTDAEIVVGNRTWTWICMLGIPLMPGVEFNMDLLKGFKCTVFMDDSGTVRMVSKLPDQVNTQSVPRGDSGTSTSSKPPSTTPLPESTPPPPPQQSTEEQDEVDNLFS